MKYIQSKFHRACRHHNIKHLVYASSSSVYGNNTKMPLSTSDNVDHPISLYTATKKSNELMAHTYSHLFGLPREIKSKILMRSIISRGESREISKAFHRGLPTTGLRFFTVYGPCLSREMRSKFQREGRPDMALFLFTKAILEDNPIKVFNSGNMPVPWNAKHIPPGVRDFTYIDDIVEGVVRVIDTPPAKGTLEARVPEGGTTEGTPSPQHNAISKGPHESSTDSSQSSPLGELEGALMQPGDVPRTEADVTDLMEDLNYKPDTPVQIGIEKFIKWYKSYFETPKKKCPLQL